MLPFVKIMVNVVDRVNNDTEKIKSAERAEEDILDEWSSELDRVTLALKKLNIMFDRFTNGDVQSRLKQRTDDDIEDVGDNLDKLMTALDNYTNAFLDKAPAQDNWPGIGPEISEAFRELTQTALKMRETIPWYLFGDDQVAATEAEKDRNAEDIAHELNDPFYFSQKLFPENIKLQRCTALNLTITLSVIAWNPPEEEAKHEDAGPDMWQFCTSPRMIAFFATYGASEAVAGYFGKGAFSAEKLQFSGRDTREADFWQHW